ncbi:hypothetical protein GPL15_18805 [Clostridium sp. MCC353]|uniref:hypothetical protein n=1 Tax=Clostridium sp. MCC353 TaxID=2592646 RepID=UPI001C03239F|nr:hypothetical protein [Clostridium sp. MCC353]MBT9778553.1 hypothetical protein [Clostridium sp. MCC353]
MSDIPWKDADIKQKVSVSSIKESNRFLRKFYNEISKEIKVAWHFQPFRTGNTIYVGMSSFGEMWLDYEIKGLIQNIYISTNNEKTHHIVAAALEEAVKCHDDLTDYDIRVTFLCQDISFSGMCRKNIIVRPASMDGKNNVTEVIFSVQAFGRFDLNYVATQKINYLRYLLCVYTNFQFELKNQYSIVKDMEYIENEWANYDPDWVDYFFDETKNPVTGELIPDFFDLFRIVLDHDSYGKTIRLILNAAQEAYCGKLMLDDILREAKYNIPGYVDMANTMLISVLEPLSNIGTEKAETCPVCGNLKYKIRKKVEDLCSDYLNEFLTKEISNIGYGQRSSFLHEGYAKTNEFYSGRCIPLLNPDAPNEILGAAPVVNINLFDYVTYIFRHKVHDLLVENRF